MIFYRSFYESIKELPEENRLRIYESLFEYAMNDQEPNLSGVDMALFKALSPQIQANNKKFEAGAKGGRPKNHRLLNNKTTGYENEKPSITNGFESEKPYSNHGFDDSKPNVNVNVECKCKNGNDNGSGFDERNTDEIFPALLSFLNSETGGTYEETEQFDDLVRDLLNRGYTEQDIRTVIHKKSIEWSCDGKMRSCLRPSVLLGDKFEEYLNAPEPIEIEEEKQHRESADELERDLEQKTDEFDSLNEEIRRIRESDNDDVNYDEFNAMKLRAAILEQEIDSIHRRLGAT